MNLNVSLTDILQRIPRFNALEIGPLPNTPEWKTSHQRVIGGTTVSAILGLNPWVTPLQAWRRLTGLDSENVSNDLMDMGSHLEPLILRKWAEQTGATVYYPIPMLIDKERPWLIASVDALAVLPDGNLAIVDAKYSTLNWHGEVATHYYLQVPIWYGEILGIPMAFVAKMDFRGVVESFPMHYDHEIAQDTMAAVDAFYQDHVLTGIPPEPTNDLEAYDAYLEKLGNRALTPAMQADQELEVLFERWDEAVRREKDAKEEQDVYRTAAAKAMSDNNVQKIKSASGASITLVERMGAVSWKSAAIAAGVTDAQAARFRGKPSIYVKFNKGK